MNKVITLGRLTRDIEMRQAGELHVGNFTLAVDRKFKKEGQPTVDFLRYVVFGKTAEIMDKYLSKGSMICVSGRLQTGSYDDKDGKKVYTTDVVVEEFSFAGGKSDGESTQSPKKDGFVPIVTEDDSDLPF